MSVAPAWAADPTRAAATLAASARQAYDAGDFVRAAELYLQAWKTAPAQTGLLYNGARASDLAGQLDDAEERYRQFLALANHDHAVDAKVAAYLDEIRLRRAEGRAALAAKAMSAGRPAEAAESYRSALERAPERLEWLPKLADADHAAGQVEAARADLRTYLDKAPADAPGRAAARLRLTEWEVQPLPVVVKPAPPATTPGWIGIGLGVATGATAGWFWWRARTEQADLNTLVSARDAQGHVVGIAYDDAVNRRDVIGLHKTVAAVAGGGALVLTAAGVWWLSTHQAARVALTPTWDGLQLTARF